MLKIVLLTEYDQKLLNSTTNIKTNAASISYCLSITKTHALFGEERNYFCASFLRLSFINQKCSLCSLIGRKTRKIMHQSALHFICIKHDFRKCKNNMGQRPHTLQCLFKEQNSQNHVIHLNIPTTTI